MRFEKPGERTYTRKPPASVIRKQKAIENAHRGYFKLECGHLISWSDAELNDAFRILETNLGPMYYGCDKCLDEGKFAWHRREIPKKVELPETPLF